MKLSKVELDNLKELYNSLQKNLIEITDALSIKSKELRNLNEEFKEVSLKVVQENEELERQRKRTIEIERHNEDSINGSLKEIEYNRNRLQEILTLISIAKKDYQDILGQISTHSGIKENLLKQRIYIKGEVDEENKKLGELSEVITLHNNSLRDIQRQIFDARNDLDNLKREHEKEIQAFITQKNELISQIEVNQHSLDSFHENAEAKKEALRIKEYNLTVLESRLRIALEKAHIPFKL